MVQLQCVKLDPPSLQTDGEIFLGVDTRADCARLRRGLPGVDSVGEFISLLPISKPLALGALRSQSLEHTRIARAKTITNP